MILYVYPTDGSKPQMRDDWQKAQDRGDPIHNFDLVAVAFEDITHVEVTRAAPKDFAAIGFSL